MVKGPLAFQQKGVNIMVRLTKKESPFLMDVIHVFAGEGLLVVLRRHALTVKLTMIVDLENTVRNNPVIAMGVFVWIFQKHVMISSNRFVDVMDKLMITRVLQREKVLM
jgi:hypothetical protein